MIVILIIVIALVAWSLHLMQEAVEQREFSLMLAGFLVAVAAAAMVAVYFLMGHYVGYMSRMTHQPDLSNEVYESIHWIVPVDSMEAWEQRCTLAQSSKSVRASGAKQYRLSVAEQYRASVAESDRPTTLNR